MDSKMIELNENKHEDIDIESICWAYKKLCAFGLKDNNEENAMMMDRLFYTILDLNEH